MKSAIARAEPVVDFILSGRWPRDHCIDRVVDALDAHAMERRTSELATLQEGAMPSINTDGTVAMLRTAIESAASMIEGTNGGDHTQAIVALGCVHKVLRSSLVALGESSKPDCSHNPINWRTIVDAEDDRKHAWCGDCGALREKSGEWNLPGVGVGGATNPKGEDDGQG